MSGALPYWGWLVAGLALCLAETLAPGAFLIWIGLAGLVVGGVDFVYPLPLEAQTLGFAALAAALALVGKRFYGSVVAKGDSAPITRAQALVGREFFLESEIDRGFGRIRVGDSVWRVSGPDLPAGAKVKVMSVGGSVTLRVEKA
jgi:membrane protein implicated in regulation of membrane protease activity